MKKFWVIFKSEYAQVVRKKSFLFGVLITPVFMMIVALLPAMLADQDVSATEPYAVIDADGQGLGDELTASLGQYKLEKDSAVSTYELTKLYTVEREERNTIDSLRVKLDSQVLAKGLKYYVVLYPGALQNDSALVVSKSLHFRTMLRMDETISNIMAKRRLEHSDINIPVDTVLSMTRRMHLMSGTPGGKTRDLQTTMLGSVSFIVILMISVMSFGQILMRSVIEEKNSRVMEILVSSVSSFQLMMGKIIGLGAASLTQIAVWVAIGGMLFLARGSLQIPTEVSDIVFNPVIIGFFVLFLVIAYVMYSTLFAFVGSICTTDKETQNLIFPINMFLILPMILLMYIIQEPDSLVSLVLSLIPLLTPAMMIARLNIAAPSTFSLSDPVIFEAMVGVVLSVIFTIFLIWITARVFRVGILMYGKRPTLPEIMKWISYK